MLKILLFLSLDDETGLVLARILDIPSVHLPTIIPTTVPPVTLMPAPGKRDKSDRRRSGKVSSKGNRSKPPPSSPVDLVQQEEKMVREKTTSNPKKQTKIQMHELLLEKHTFFSEEFELWLCKFLTIRGALKDMFYSFSCSLMYVWQLLINLVFVAP